ncbi:MAG: T9SS type A sorting domain-containing protein [Deltaproteobacteria bacterium]
MKKFVFLVITLIFAISAIYAQNKRDYTWIFGITLISPFHETKGNIMDFNKKGRIDTLIMYENVADHNAEISDLNGNLLFYFNGCRIVSGTSQLMENGDSINFGKTWQNGYCGYNYSTYPGSQNSIILPDPGNENGYYLIHKRTELKYEPFLEVSIPELQYTYVDMSANNGKGKVIKKNKDIFKTRDIVSGYLSACKHANGKDWWLIQMEQDTNIYFKTLLTKDGFSVDSQSIAESPIFTPWTGVGQSVFSPDGSKWMMFGDINGPLQGNGGALIYDFDRESGLLSNMQLVETQDSGGFVGCAISPNSRFAYLSARWDLYQIDLWADDIQSSLTHIDHIDGFKDPNFISFFSQAQLAPDCKIYIVSSTTNNYFHVINKPNEKGKECDFRQHSLYLPNRNYNGSIPNFPHFRMDEAEICDPTITSIFGDAVWYRRDMEVWPNPSSGVFNIRLPDVGKGKLVVMNIEGQVVYKRDVSNIIKDERIDISGYPSGTYNVEFYPERLEKERVFYREQVVKN